MPQAENYVIVVCDGVEQSRVSLGGRAAKIDTSGMNIVIDLVTVAPVLREAPAPVTEPADAPDATMTAHRGWKTICKTAAKK